MTADDGAIGRAQVYGGSINPLQLYIQQGAQRRQAQAAQQQQIIKQRDELIKDLRQFNPDKVWEPFYDEVNRKVQTDIRDFTTNALAAGATPQQVIPEAEKRKGDANTLVNKINWMKQQYTDIGKRIDDDDYLNPDYYHSKLNDYVFNGNIARHSSEINLKDADQMFRDSKGYKVDKIVTDFMKELPEKVNQHYSKVFEPLGNMYNIEETSTKLGHEYKIGDDGQRKIVIDPRTGLPKINMTDDVFTQALGNEYLMNIVTDGLTEAGMAQNTKNQKEFLTHLLAGKDPNQIKRDIRLGFKKPDSDIRHNIFGGYGYKNNPDDLKGRDELLERVVSSKGGSDVLSYFSNLTKDIKAEYATVGGKKVINIHYPGYNNDYIPPTPEQLDAMPAVAQLAALEEMRKNRIMKSKPLPITTDEEKRAAKIFLSERMDEIDKKRSIGQEYMTYINEKRKVDSKKKGASGVSWK